MQQVSPLQAEVMQTLKELNEANGENEALQQQVRQLDLLSRKAYFVKEGQLKVGLFILLAMAGVLVVSGIHALCHRFAVTVKGGTEQCF